MCFSWISWFIERLSFKPPKNTNPVVQRFSCPQKTLLHFSLPRYGGRSQECPDNIITYSDVSCWKGRLSFFRFFNVFFFKCFFFRKIKTSRKVGKVFLRTWAGTGPSQRHVISRGRELFKHYIDSRGYLFGLMVPSPKQSSNLVDVQYELKWMVRMKWNEMTWSFHMFGPFVIGFSALHSEHWYPYQSKFCLEKHPFWNAERTFEPNFPLQSWNCFAVRKSFNGRPKEVGENIQSRSPDQILWNLKTSHIEIKKNM